MNIDQFWRKADDILTIYRTRYRHTILTDDEQIENVGDFLVDMSTLAIEWYSRNDNQNNTNGKNSKNNKESK